MDIDKIKEMIGTVGLSEDKLKNMSSTNIGNTTTTEEKIRRMLG